MIDKITIMNEARERYRLTHENEVKEKAELSFKQYKNEVLFVAGIMLYWAEGTRPAKYRKHQLALTNSDPELLEVYCSFLRGYLGNIDSSMRIALYIYQDIDEYKSKLFWSNRLKIPLNQPG